MRTRLPNRRFSYNLSFEHWGQGFHATIGFDTGGRVREVFLNVGKTGEHLETLAQAHSVSVSRLLQYGDSLEQIRKSLPRDSHGNPSDPMGKLLDLLA